jgi:hypothetical protein
MAKVRYSSTRNSRIQKIVSTLVTAGGALSYSGVGHTLSRMGNAMSGNPVADAVLGLGVLGMGYAFRDTLLAPFGWWTPQRAERQIRAWLDTQSYSVKRESVPKGFLLTVTDTSNRKFAIAWTEEPYSSVMVSSQWGIGADLVQSWGTATPADLRQLTTRLMDVGRVLDGGGAVVSDLADAAKATIFYGARIPEDLLNYEEFFRLLGAVEGCLIMAINLTTDLHETLKERAVFTPPALPPVQ